MGYPFNAAMKALYHTNESLEVSFLDRKIPSLIQLAMEWLMSNLDSPDFNEPLKLDKGAKEEKSFSPEIIAMVTSMGFTDKQSKKALSGKFYFSIR